MENIKAKSRLHGREDRDTNAKTTTHVTSEGPFRFSLEKYTAFQILIDKLKSKSASWMAHRSLGQEEPLYSILLSLVY